MLQDTVLNIVSGHFVTDIPQCRMFLHKKIGLSQELTDYSSAAKIVHGRIPNTALQVLCTVTPVLRQDISLRIDFLNTLAYFRPQFIRKLHHVIPCKGVSHVKAPTVNIVGRFQPFLQYRVLSAVNDFTQFL